MRPDGKTCACRSGSECGTPGKHPIEPGWQISATTDESIIAEWFEDDREPNISVKLGPDSGIIDVEWDDAAGEATAEKLGLKGIDTPTYISSRSEHRLFAFDPRLPEQAVVKIAGLEIRIGGGRKGAQSVFPPSLHASGVRYRWKEGFAPGDVPVAKIPDSLMTVILNEKGGGELSRSSTTEILHKVATAGGRHDALVRIAARNCINMLDCHDPQEQQDVFATLRSLNQTQCSPPKPAKEVEDIWRSALRWAIKVRAAGDRVDRKGAVETYVESGGEPEAEAGSPAEPEGGIECPFTLTGLEFRDGEWWPGQWKLKVIHNDPVSFVMTVPVFEKGRTKLVDVTMDAENYRSAAKVAQKVLEATHTVILDAIPEQWGRIWAGQAAKPKLGLTACRGLKAKLMDKAIEEAGAGECLRYAEVASWFLDVLSASPEPGDEADEDGEPDATGRPAWVRRHGLWELWFSWGPVWSIVERQHKTLIEGEKAQTRKLILAVTGDMELAAGRAKGLGGQSKRYIRFTAKHLRALETFATGELGETPFQYTRDGICNSDMGGKVVNVVNATEVTAV
jgi:hypothetical protein